MRNIVQVEERIEYLRKVGSSQIPSVICAEVYDEKNDTYTYEDIDVYQYMYELANLARQDTLQEVIEIIESAELTATRTNARDTTPEKAKVVNEWLMPEVKRSIIEAIRRLKPATLD